MVGRLSLNGLCIKRAMQADPILECFPKHRPTLFERGMYKMGQVGRPYVRVFPHFIGRLSFKGIHINRAN
jgi:hypothetical protein